MTKANTSKTLLFASSVLAGVVAFGGVAAAATQPSATGPSPAAQVPVAGAQTGSTAGGAISSPQTTPQSSANGASPAGESEVVVTGSILRRSLAATDAPITVVTAADLNNRGITTVANAVQLIAANGSSSLPNSFTANGAFAAGASAASLRGLTTNSTLTLIDGLRVTYYPLADDGTRNFVDLNTIPDIIVDRVETLKDGASSTYGADAIAGVVNVITKKTFQGVEARAEGGFSQHGGGSESNVQVLGGKGDLATDGYNVYLGLEYEHDDILRNRDRGYPYNTADQSRTIGTSLNGGLTARTNGIVNGLQYDGSFEGVGTTTVPVIRPFRQNADGSYTAIGDYRLLNPAAGCGSLATVTITPAQAAAGGATGITAPVTLCQQDNTKQFGVISPDDKRFSSSLRFTKQINNDTQAYFAANYYQNKVFSPGGPSSIRQQSTPGALGLTYSTSGTPGILLPVYVCATGQSCSAANGMLNPNNPLANQGIPVSIRYDFGDIPSSNTQFVQTYRFAAGISGQFDLFGTWHYTVDATGSQSDLKNSARGDIYIQGLLQAVATGAYNFVDPSKNTAAVRSLISPQVDQYSRSQLAQLQVNLTRDLFQLPGGPLQLGISGAIRYEAIYNPSANTDANGPTNRFFTINPFGTIGSRNTQAGSFELDAPILKQIDVNFSGRYDSYSTGQDAFSPKVGGRIRPFADWAPAFDRITLRSTYSEGFRIPSFAESNSLPTTGFITSTAPASFLALHNNDGYGRGYALGLTTSGTAGLKPEDSQNFTAGLVFEPIRNISLSFDFYRIKKTNFITPNTSNQGAAIAAYYAGTAIPAGYTVIPGVSDPNLPNAKPTLGFLGFGFTNLGTETTSGYDIGATARFDLPYGVKYTSVFDGNYVLRLNLNPEDGAPVQHFAGTIGPYNNVAAGGTPKFRANWANTLAYGPFSFTATAYFTDGYALQAEDEGDVTGVCVGGSINTTFLDGVTPVSCKVKPFWDVDVHLTYQVRSNLQLYADIQNIADKPAPYDPTTYGGTNYNSTFANQGIYGRYFKFGVRANF